MRDLEGLPKVNFLALDIVKAGDIKAVVDAVFNHARFLDYLIHNAARNYFMLMDENLNIVRGLFEINFIGPIVF